MSDVETFRIIKKVENQYLSDKKAENVIPDRRV